MEPLTLSWEEVEDRQTHILRRFRVLECREAYKSKRLPEKVLQARKEVSKIAAHRRLTIREMTPCYPKRFLECCRVFWARRDSYLIYPEPTYKISLETVLCLVR